MEAIEILTVARAKIAIQKTWGKGRRIRDRPLETCCAAEAIEESSPCGDERRRALRAFMNAAGIESEWGALTDWNDAPERAHQEVIATFNLAIAILRLR